jgi:hypothetical protein
LKSALQNTTVIDIPRYRETNVQPGTGVKLLLGSEYGHSTLHLVDGITGFSYCFCDDATVNAIREHLNG